MVINKLIICKSVIIKESIGGIKLNKRTKKVVFGLLTLFAVSILMVLLKNIYNEKSKQ